MHPEIARSMAAQRRAELQRLAGIHRGAGLRHLAARRAGGQRLMAKGRLAAVHQMGVRQMGARLMGLRLSPVRRSPGRRLPVISLTGARPGRDRGPAARGGALPGVFVAGPEAFGLRTYLTPAEARQLAADWADLLARFADRADDPSRRPDGAVPFEVVVLGRQVPDLTGAGRGLPGPGQAD